MRREIAEFDYLDDSEQYVELENNLQQVLEDISEICTTNNKKIVDEHLGRSDDPNQGFNETKTWAMKKRLAPKNTLDNPAAKKDAEGTLITDKSLLKNCMRKLIKNGYLPTQL